MIHNCNIGLILWQQTLSRRADSEDQEDDDGKAQDAQELLNEIEQSKNQETGKIEDPHVIKFFRDKLHSKPCQNQGFILDGFPKTIEQANELFASKSHLLSWNTLWFVSQRKNFMF